VKFKRWVQLEAEGRWLRFNQYGGISQNNYLIGPRVPVLHFWRSSIYAKALGGYAKMNFDSFGNKGTFTDLAFGGGMDVNLTKRISIRAADFEYQYYPKWSNSTLSPYGASVGIGYKLF
jgi:opacity protein-like surface antigen